MRLDPSSKLPTASVVVAGPPCQPFSIAGKQLGPSDNRDGFPTIISTVRRIKPALFLIENVRGLSYKSKDYLDRVIKEFQGLGYHVDCELLNSADYGVPQNRRRLILVGHQGHFRFPRPSGTVLTAGEALRGLPQVSPQASKFLTPSMDAYVARYEKASCLRTPRDLHLDRPARTLTARNLAGATGDMQRLRLPDSRRRRLTVREAARLQSFPDWFTFEGSETSQLQQIGNAVAPKLAYELARSVREYLDEST